MAIFLVQHGRCFAKEDDPDRSLTPEGRQEILKVAEQAAEAGVSVASICHSGKLRARQTAELFAQTLKSGRIEGIDGIAPLDDVEAFVEHFHWPENTMIVGHLPFMERLASYLLTGHPEPAVVKFQNAGIVCLEQGENQRWIVKWMIMPVID